MVLNELNFFVGITNKDLGPYYKCVACNKDIPNHLTTINRHNTNKFYRRTLELLDKQGILTQWNII
jgi:hypothetical protein